MKSAMTLGGYWEYIPLSQHWFSGPDEIWLLASSCMPSRWKRAFAFFFHPVAPPVPVVISTDVPPKLTFFGPLAELSLGMASFAKASVVLLTFWAEIEGPVGRE
jgi:hypothetical protein